MVFMDFANWIGRSGIYSVQDLGMEASERASGYQA